MTQWKTPQREEGSPTGNGRSLKPFLIALVYNQTGKAGLNSTCKQYQWPGVIKLRGMSMVSCIQGFVMSHIA